MSGLLSDTHRARTDKHLALQGKALVHALQNRFDLEST
jgi:hypothetical protein